VNQRDFNKQGENIHQRLIEEIFKKDKQMQAQFREQFTTQPSAFREQMERIEAGAKGFAMQDGVAINNKTGEPASEVEHKLIQDATDKAMMRQNPDLERYNMRHDNGFFTPLTSKKSLRRRGCDGRHMDRRVGRSHQPLSVRLEPWKHQQLPPCRA